MIKIKNLKKYYPLAKGYIETIFHPLQSKKVLALDGIDLNIAAGKIFFLIGPNGAGKTTLIKILATLLLPDMGTAHINGIDVQRDPEKVKSMIGYAICDDRSFYWRLSGRQNLEFYAALNKIPRKEAKDKIEELLKLTNLIDAADHRFNTYSTGMRQMLSIARALLLEPEIILIDEPTKSLDPQLARKICKFLCEELAEKRKHTILWSSHNLAEVEKYGHDLAIIKNGKIRLSGTINTITNNGKFTLEDIYNKIVEN